MIIIVIHLQNWFVVVKTTSHLTQLLTTNTRQRNLSQILELYKQWLHQCRILPTRHDWRNLVQSDKSENIIVSWSPDWTGVFTGGYSPISHDKSTVDLDFSWFSSLNTNYQTICGITTTATCIFIWIISSHQVTTNLLFTIATESFWQ